MDSWHPRRVLTLEHLSALLEAHRDAAAVRVREFEIRGRTFPWNAAPAIMGVVNLSADSWYRESVCLSEEGAVRLGLTQAALGAAIIDVGAESTLAAAARADEQLQRSLLLPVVRRLSAGSVIVSVETYLPAVARAAFEAGAGVLNLTGAAEAEEAYRIAADHDGAVIICYVEGSNVREVGEFDFGSDPFARMERYFGDQVALAERCGVKRIFIDPGLGFYYRNLQDSGVRIRHQMNVFLNSFRLRALGWPVCHALPHAFEFFGPEVRSAEPFFAVLASLGRTDLFRTHEVPRVRAVLDTLNCFEPLKSAS